MKVLNTAIPAGPSMPTGKVGRKWTKVYIDNLGEFVDLMQIDTMRIKGSDEDALYPVLDSVVVEVKWVSYYDLKVELISKGVVVAKGRLPC